MSRNLSPPQALVLRRDAAKKPFSLFWYGVPFLLLPFIFYLCSGLEWSDKIYHRSLSHELSNAPRIIEALSRAGIMDGDGGLIRLCIFDASGHQLPLTSSQFAQGGKKIDYWVWQKTGNFSLAPDAYRDQINDIAKQFPPESDLMPIYLGAFLVEICPPETSNFLLESSAR